MRILPLLLFTLIAISKASKILVYSPIFAHSHTKFLASIAEILTEEGHEVTVLMPIVDPSERNKTCLKKTKNQIFVEPDERVAELIQYKKNMMRNLWVENQENPLNKLQMIGNMTKLFKWSCESLVTNEPLLAKLRAENFDLGISEPFGMCGFAIFQLIKLEKYVSALSCVKLDHVSSAIGEPATPSYVPGVQSVYSDRMNIWQRLLNSVQYLMGDLVFRLVGDGEFEVARQHHPSTQMAKWQDVVAESTFVFTNTIPFLDFPSPTLAKVIPIGGVSVDTKTTAAKLPPKWHKILNQRTNNVFISFGSNARAVDMPQSFKDQLVQLFTSMSDTTFIFKYEDEADTFVAHLPNVHLGAWLPQTDILADRRLSLFITHGGLGSVMELSALGTPSILIPLFADQYRNAKMLERHGGAVTLDKNSLNDHRLVEQAIQKVLNEPKFKENAKRLAEMLANQPTDVRQTLVKHVQFAARFGKQPQTDPYGRKLNIFQYYLIDGILLVFSIIFVVFFFIYKLFRVIVCRLRVTKRKRD